MGHLPPRSQTVINTFGLSGHHSLNRFKQHVGLALNIAVTTVSAEINLHTTSKSFKLSNLHQKDWNLFKYKSEVTKMADQVGIAA